MMRKYILEGENKYMKREELMKRILLFSFNEYVESDCLNAVKREPRALQFVKCMNDEICLTAVKQNGRMLKFIDSKHQTEEICLAAVKQDGFA